MNLFQNLNKTAANLDPEKNQWYRQKISGLVKKADFNAKITEAKNKIPSTTGLVTSFALTAVENETPNACSLLRKKKQIMIQIFQILIKINVMQKYQVLKKKKKSTAGYNKCTKDIVGDNIKRKNLVDKSDISEFKNNAGLDKKSSNISKKSWTTSRAK